MISLQISPLKPHKDRFTSTSGLGIIGQSSFLTPKDFTPVCTTELGAVAGLEKQFADRGAKVIGLSVDPVKSHGKCAQDIQDVSGHKVNYPIIGDTELKVAKLLRHATSRRR
jgi:alkyl hydroperoxide reductase subunit AhpC